MKGENNNMINILSRTVLTMTTFAIAFMAFAVCNWGPGGPLGDCNQPADCGFGSRATGAGPSTFHCYVSMDETCCFCERYELNCENYFGQPFTVNVALPSTQPGNLCMPNNRCRDIEQG